jgi:hypothetical protein
MRWSPLVASAAGVGALVLALHAAGAPRLSGPPGLIVVAVLVAAAALALDDPAHALVAATPVRFARRVLHRLMWLAPATLLTLVGIGWIAARLGVAAVSVSELARAAALGALAVAAHVIVAQRRPDLAASVATATPALAVTFGVSTRRDMMGGTIAHLWLDRPWAVVVCATAAGAAAARSR